MFLFYSRSFRGSCLISMKRAHFTLFYFILQTVGTPPQLQHWSLPTLLAVTQKLSFTPVGAALHPQQQIPIAMSMVVDVIAAIDGATR